MKLYCSVFKRLNDFFSSSIPNCHINGSEGTILDEGTKVPIPMRAITIDATMIAVIRFTVWTERLHFKLLPRKNSEVTFAIRIKRVICKTKVIIIYNEEIVIRHNKPFEFISKIKACFRQIKLKLFLKKMNVT